MADNLRVFGNTYNNAVGVKLTDTNGNEVVYTAGGSGDLSTCTLTLTCNGTGTIKVLVSNVYMSDEEDELTVPNTYASESAPSTIDVILYKGMAVLFLESESITLSSLSGGIEYVDGAYIITGDCSAVASLIS